MVLQCKSSRNRTNTIKEHLALFVWSLPGLGSGGGVREGRVAGGEGGMVGEREGEDGVVDRKVSSEEGERGRGNGGTEVLKEKKRS